MTIAVLADEILKKEFSSRAFPPHVEIIWADSVRSLMIIEADAYFDLEYSFQPERLRQLAKLFPSPVLVNSVPNTTRQLGEGFIRINAWPTMLKRTVAELAIGKGVDEKAVQSLFTALNWKYQLVDDLPGMIVPRIIAMIINEAYYTLEAGVSTKQEIDIAMKLGTNYPMGPFEWSTAIGLKNIEALLRELSRNDSRYMVCPLLESEANAVDGP